MDRINVNEGEQVKCPYCEHLVLGDNYVFSQCKHTVYFASSEGFEYLAVNISLDIENNRYRSCIDEVTDALTSKTTGNSIKYVIESVSGLEGYIGFESS